MAELLCLHDIGFARVDGSMSFSQRQQAFQSFKTSSDVNILLMTVGTGAVGYQHFSFLAVGNTLLTSIQTQSLHRHPSAYYGTVVESDDRAASNWPRCSSRTNALCGYNSIYYDKYY